MLNPVITPELALMLKRAEVTADEMNLDIDTVCNIHEIEALAKYHRDSCDALTVGEEPLDLASEIEPTVWDKYLPNDGTPAVERRLRKQGLRKAEDSTREEVQELYVEVWDRTHRARRIRVLRQLGGDLVLH